VKRLAVLAFFALAAPASASTPVVGGGSFNAAPQLAPGSYRDTILPTEYLYYGVRVEAGQRLHVTANADLPINSFLSTGLSDITASIHSPTRDILDKGDVTGTFRVAGEPPLDIVSPDADSEPDTEVEGPWPGPGVYFVSFYAIYVGERQPPPRAEVPFHFTLSVDGEAQATPTPSPSPSPTPTPKAKSSRPGTAVAAIAAVAALLVGVLAGRRFRSAGTS
jgi:Ca-activated chloride channel family protein